MSAEGKVVVSGFLTVQTDKVADFTAAFQECIDITVKEKGCILYDFSVNRNNSSMIVLYEEWESAETLAAHSAAAHVLAAFAVIAPMLSAPPTINKYVIAKQL